MLHINYSLTQGKERLPAIQPIYLPCNEMGSYGINKFCKGTIYLSEKHLYNVASS